MHGWALAPGVCPRGQGPGPLQRVGGGRQGLSTAWAPVAAGWAAACPAVWSLSLTPLLSSRPPHSPACLSPRTPLPASARLGSYAQPEAVQGLGAGGPRAPCASLPGARITGRAQTSHQGGGWWLQAGVGSPFSHKALATRSTSTTNPAGDKAPPPPCPDPAPPVPQAGVGSLSPPW